MSTGAGEAAAPTGARSAGDPDTVTPPRGAPGRSFAAPSSTGRAHRHGPPGATASNGTYGAPRIHAELADADLKHGRERIARRMQAAGIRGSNPRRRQVTGLLPGRSRCLWSSRCVRRPVTLS
ncbi:IS3 family transposase [Jidongwangia harbinensis]|uniref:IS3 family transposase n=1 Tax=Jidongwangia harbinensis TaxID=2878561 RepID=UPI003556D723